MGESQENRWRRRSGKRSPPGCSKPSSENLGSLRSRRYNEFGKLVRDVRQTSVAPVNAPTCRQLFAIGFDPKVIP